MSGWDKMNGERGSQKRVVKEGEVKEEMERSGLRAAYVLSYLLIMSVVMDGLC
jgi:hypothetical protein